MGRRLTEKEVEERNIQKAIRRIKTIEKDYGIETTRHAAQRYSMRRREENRLEREIKEKETICDVCGCEMRLQGVGTYNEAGKQPRGARYYFCYKLCKEWKTAYDEPAQETE